MPVSECTCVQVRCVLFTPPQKTTTARWAAAADPKAELCLNDFHVVNGDAAPQLARMASDLVAQGVPLHCLGVQSFVGRAEVPSRRLRAALDILATTGLKVYITEFNVVSQ